MSQPITHRRRMARARKSVAKMERRIERAAAAGEIERARRLRRMLLRSYDNRLSACHKAARRDREDLRPAELHRRAHHLNVLKGSRDAAARRRRPNHHGGHRTYYDFTGTEHRALQYVVRPALLAGAPGGDWNYMRRGAGRDAMARRVAADLENHRYVVLADIAACYDSMNDRAGAARLLPIPATATQNVVLGGDLGASNSPTRRRRRCRGQHSRTRWSAIGITRGCRGHVDHGGHGITRHAPPGLIQGSACSDAAMGWLMAPVASAVGGGLRLYGDDVVMPARTLREARASERTLESALAGHLAGTLVIGRRRIARREDGMNVIGYFVRRRRGITTVAPSRRALHRIIFKFIDALNTDAIAGRAAPAASARVLRHWRAGYPAWPNGDRWVDRMVAKARRDLE